MENNNYISPISYTNIYNEAKKVEKTCKNKNKLEEFILNESSNIYKILNDLYYKKYTPNKFNLFVINEPKERLVMSQLPIDKVVNHFITDYYLIPILDKKLIDSNVATRKNKGLNHAEELLNKYINTIRLNDKDKEIYAMHIDISKYFYNINHDILINKLEKHIKDKDIINLIRIIISETNKPYINEFINNYNNKHNSNLPIYKYNTGLSIGAMTSQFLAIFYLNDLDHYIKEKLKHKYYIRYMDDLIILDTNYNKLKIVLII